MDKIEMIIPGRQLGIQIVVPEIANIIGLEESIVLHQIHYWIKKCGKTLTNKEGY
ncbi:hypothetical protein MIDIC_10015 [Alphaproteobacteria bacterium]